MKQLFFILALLTGICVTTIAQTAQPITTAEDSIRTDTTVVSHIQDAEEDAKEDANEDAKPSGRVHARVFFSSDDFTSDLSEEGIVAIAAIFICCGLPLFIVFFILWFRYKNKQARYKLASEALAAGQAIPHELLEGSDSQDQKVLVKGIKNICLGFGLGVFLWFLTEDEGITAIGFLVFCMGVGQVLIAYATRPKQDKPTDLTHNDEKE